MDSADKLSGALHTFAHVANSELETLQQAVARVIVRASDGKIIGTRFDIGALQDLDDSVKVMVEYGNKWKAASNAFLGSF